MLFFLDFEASSLSPNTVPIEIGWAGMDGSLVSHIIRPAPGWTDWDPKSEAIHGISREQRMREGLSVGEVAEHVLAAFGQPDALILSDNPQWEQHWLNRLLDAAGVRQRFSVGSVYPFYVEAARTHERLSAVFQAERERPRVRHRAAPDADGMRWIYEQLLKE